MFEATSSEPVLATAASSETSEADGHLPDAMPPDVVIDAQATKRSNVVGIDGKAFVQPEGPHVSATLIGELERLLEAAKAGDILGMAGSFIHADRLVSYSFAGAVGGFGVIGGLECLKERLVRNALTTD